MHGLKQTIRVLFAASLSRVTNFGDFRNFDTFALSAGSKVPLTERHVTSFTHHTFYATVKEQRSMLLPYAAARICVHEQPE